MSTVKNWISAFRLRTLPLSLSCILTGSGFAIYFNQFNSLTFGLCVITTILLQILSNLANDYGDTIKGTDNENRVGPERAMQSGVITNKQMKVAIIINSLLAFTSGLVLIFTAFKEGDKSIILLFILLGIASIVAAIKYTMGKKPYGYSGLGDIFVFLFFGLVGVMGTYYLYTLQFEFKLLFFAVPIGLLSASVLNMNNMRDEVNDKASNKNTLVVKIGSKKAKVYHTFLISFSFISLIIGMNIFRLPYLSFICLIPYLILFNNIRTTWKNKIKAELDKELKKIALSTFAISLLLFITLIFTK